ncbi:752e701f-a606-4a2d-9fb0-d6a095d8af4b [Thermothielavioides terrestris]|uniref:Polyprenal reductase n=1 Tax=Thermothielavioides terrestris TaxID=2587410 RepID=A0A446BIW7_9PEZI|nr:752e701f-a606-4a2d-9fb0-d6a095d8af4b [Thermothielavioides terrestris]
MGWDRLLQLFLSTLSRATPAQWCQGFFLLAAGGVAAVAALPQAVSKYTLPLRAPDRGWLLSLIGTVTSWTQVPHSWFSAFYVVSLACSVFWLVQYLGSGAVLRSIASRQASAGEPSCTLGQAALGWLMLFLQGTRRAYEHAAVIRPSKSTMWIVHWLLGLSFYLAMSVSIWVEAAGALLDPAAGHTDDAQSLLKMAAAVPAFLFAWVNQYRCHKHLAGLKKYSLPEGGMFRRCICPHYTCECLLYLSMAVATAPRGAWCNSTLLCALVFVAVNLGVTASGTREWYIEKFGNGPVADKWNMIPFFF